MSNTQLNQKFQNGVDRLNSVLAQAEVRLKGLKIPTDTLYEYHKATQTHCAAIFKIKGEWTLGYVLKEDGVEQPFKPYRECSVLIRLELVKNLGFLENRILEVKKSFIEEIDRVCSIGEKFLDSPQIET
jgi:hypothetical protein